MKGYREFVQFISCYFNFELKHFRLKFYYKELVRRGISLQEMRETIIYLVNSIHCEVLPSIDQFIIVHEHLKGRLDLREEKERPQIYDEIEKIIDSSSLRWNEDEKNIFYLCCKKIKIDFKFLQLLEQSIEGSDSIGPNQLAYELMEILEKEEKKDGRKIKSAPKKACEILRENFGDFL